MVGGERSSLKSYESWGRVVRVQHRVHSPAWLDDLRWMRDVPGTILAYGKGRSYGDSCLNVGGALLDISGCDRFLVFDQETGILRAEAGTTLAQILEVCVPMGFFLPVTPGTKYVTLGGAVANDIHGKNHHVAGTFGMHVTQLELARSDGSRVICSPERESALFAATVGGLGLTGIMTWVEIRLVRIASAFITGELVRFAGLREYLSLSSESDASYEFTMAWCDTIAVGRSMGRGVLFRGNWAPASGTAVLRAHRDPSLVVPLEAPQFLLNPLVMRAFNEGYYALHGLPNMSGQRLMHYDPFFYPLDKIGRWNRLYGKRGFYQYQFAMPAGDVAALERVFALVAASGRGSFLAVLKTFGAKTSPGLLSFPQEGVTLALDFANTGPGTEAFLRELDQIVAANGGRSYPAKDAVMTRATFEQYYPARRAFEEFIDPKLSSSFWRRVS